MAYPVQAGPVAAPPGPAGDPTAVFGRRVVASLIDGVLVIGPAVATATAEFEYLPVDALGMDPQVFCDRYIAEQDGFCANTADIDDRVYFSDGSFVSSGLVFWGLGLLLLVVLQGLTGWTVGKLITGIRTVKEDGTPPGLVKSFLRWLLWVVDGQPCGLPLVGFITGLTTTGHRRVGDMAAKTFVVRASVAGAPVSVPGLTSPPTAPVAAYGTPSAWGAAADTGPAAGPAAGATGPQWDPQRGTYIQWDPAQRRWLQWDEATRAWTTIPGQ